MNLIEYLEKMNDDEKAARLFGVKPRTVLSWRLGDRVPKRKHAEVIVQRSPVTYDGIFGHNGKRAA